MIRCQIEKLVLGGLSLARTSEGVVLLRGGLPGEEVEAEVRKRKNHLEGTVTQILNPHPQRYSRPLPPTADFPLEYPEQLPIKQEFLAEALSRIAKLSFPLSPIVPSPDALAYRTSAQYALHPLGGLAYREPRTNELIKIHRDPLIAPPLQPAFELLSNWPLSNLDEVVLRGSLYENRVQVGLIGGEARYFKRAAQALVQEGIAGVVWAESDSRGRFRGRVQLLAGEGSLLEDFGGVLSTVNVQSFAQVNPKAAGPMFQEAARIVGPGARAIELYAGSGTLSLHLSNHFEEIVAIEINRDAIKRGEADAERLGVKNLRFRQDDAKVFGKFLPAEGVAVGHSRHAANLDLVAVDPPRAGLSAEVISALIEARPGQILYISCEGSTWARDVRKLVDAGYGLSFVRPYDFYPFTHHVEVLSLLSLRSAEG